MKWFVLLRLFCVLFLFMASVDSRAVTAAEAYSSCMSSSNVNDAWRWANGTCEVFPDNSGLGRVCYQGVYTDSSGYHVLSSQYCGDPVVNDCSTRPNLNSAAFVGASGGGSCSGGCMYRPASNANSVELGSGSSIFAGASAWSPTGEACEAEDTKQPFDPNKETCTANGSFMECVKPDGTHCVASTDGAGVTKNLCWPPFETGQKITKDGKLAANRVEAPASSNVVISNQTNSTVVTSTTTTINNKTYNQTTYSGTGNTGGQANTGTGNDSGEGGTGDDQGEDAGAGAPSGDLGTLYEDPGLTVTGIAGDFFVQVMATPIAQSIGTFMTVPAGGGSCPVFTLEASTYWEAQTLDLHCNGAMLAALQAAGYLCLAIATYVAARIAFT